MQGFKVVMGAVVMVGSLAAVVSNKLSRVPKKKEEPEEEKNRSEFDFPAFTRCPPEGAEIEPDIRTRRKRWPVPGMIFGDVGKKYQVTRFLGEGTDLVYECHPVGKEGELYAVKIYDPSYHKNADKNYQTDVDFFEAFQAGDTCMYKGRNLLVGMIDNFQQSTGDCHFLVMEKVQDSASEIDINEELNKRGALDEDVAKDVFRQLLEAVRWLHKQNYIHRDLKCPNILIASSYINTDDGKKYFHIKLTDFGIARTVDRQLSFATTDRGTYKPPEVDGGGRGLYNGKAVDVWGLAVTLWTLVLGEEFPGPALAKRAEASIAPPEDSNWFVKPLSAEFKDLMEKMLRWEADPAGFHSRINLEDCMAHPWVAPPKDSPPSVPKRRLQTSSKKLYCQRLQVTRSQTDGWCVVLDEAAYSKCVGRIIKEGSMSKKCLGAAKKYNRQCLSVVSMGVCAERTQPKLILREGDTVYYGVSSTLSENRPALAPHSGFEERLCRITPNGKNPDVGLGYMELVEFKVPSFMDKCVIGDKFHARGNQGWIRFRNNFGSLTIAALRKKDGKEIFFPSASDVLEEGDILFLPRRFANVYNDDVPEFRKSDELNEEERIDDLLFESELSIHVANFENAEYFEELVRNNRASRASRASSASNGSA